ncbi:MAG: hypothetical protein S4CHLAM2_14780 [Chlamydiales bacterium]|nr:hypothetical protein [Chlamydiales bacterium]
MRPTVKKVSRFLTYHPEVFINDPAYQLSTLRHAPEMSDVIWEVKRALKKGISPEKSMQGTSETYFLKDEEGKPLAVFKLEHYLQEYATYRLDHKGFSGVPPTVIAAFTHPLFGGEATGSCQLYVEDSISAVELSESVFTGFSPAPIRRIAQLDIRVLNADRHTSNILICDETEAVPIDHGFALPRELGSVHFAWMFWNQAATPFSEEEQSYIAWIDPEKDRALLIEETGLSEKIANRLYVATMLLKMGVMRGFYPHNIGDIVAKTRDRRAPDSKFELLIKRLLERGAEDWTTFTRYVNEEIECTLGEYETNQHKNLSILGGI